MTSYSQTVKENIEKLSKDPKTTENASKADVYGMSNKKNIGDTTVVQSIDTSKRVERNSRKQKRCKKS